MALSTPTKLTYVGRERRLAKIAAMQDARSLVDRYPIEVALQRMQEKQIQWQRELDEDAKR